ncbi:MAG: GTP pyrophosphokinase family protein [bacterium]
MDFLNNLDPNIINELQINRKKYQELMMHYECAMIEVKTKLDVLNKELSMFEERNSFDSVLSRLKSPESIYNKLQKFGYSFNVENIEKYIEDVAGIRVICSFQDDIYNIAKYLCDQDDVKVVLIKDYIREPKDNGYRSFHLVLSVPIFLSNQKKHVNIEVQFRTIAMDFWASLEHKMKYKKDIENIKEITTELKDCADLITEIDIRMNRIKDRIVGKE